MAYIKPFVRFSFKHPEKLGRRNKAKITKYFKFIKETEKGFFAIKAKRFNTAQNQLNPEFKRIPKKIKNTEFKVIFVPKNNPPGTRVEFDGKKAFFRSEFMRQEFIPFLDKERLAFETKEYIAELVKDLPKDARVSIQTATASISGSWSPDLIASEMGDFVTESGNEDLSTWLVGLNVTYLENQVA